jgi:hypothetical protein
MRQVIVSQYGDVNKALSHDPSGSAASWIHMPP